MDGADEVKRDGDEVCPKPEGDDDGLKVLVEVESPKVDELNGVDDVPKPVEGKDGVFGVNKLGPVAVLKGLVDA